MSIKRSIITLSAVAALSTSSYALTHDDMMQQLEMLKAQIAALEGKLKQNEASLKNNKTLLGTLQSDDNLAKRVTDLEVKAKKVDAKVSKNSKKVREAKMLANADNIKWDVDLRTAIDNIQYEHISGEKSKNKDLMTNRLWLGMGYAPDNNTLFKGKISYNKTFGDTANHSQSNSALGVGFADFDWVTNENAIDGNLAIKEAYWLYMDDTIGGTEIPWTISIGRRPSTDGLGINMREGMKDNSPLSHTVNVEFDGLSSRWDLAKVTGVEGMWWKLCTGRGLTNATPRFNMTIPGADYAKDESKNPDIDMYGFIFVPYDNGQYSIHTNFARATNLIGFTEASMMSYSMASQGIDPTNPNLQLDGVTASNVATSADTSVLIPSASMAYAPTFQNFGDMDLYTAMFKAEGIGDEINDFLDDTVFFASVAASKTHPKAGMNMLGSAQSQSGHSEWIGVNMPDPFTSNGRWGIEWNKGSKYWRSVTYGEDTMVGSKIAARGTAWEIYYNKPINKYLSFNARLTDIKYDYTGSNSFFGEDGTPYTIAEAKARYAARLGADVVESARDIRFSISYKF
ncbi:MAG: DUF3373 family protein [Campylobacterota bacterium]|nr:DUF3373 family protein [Campylobacterota bacterium]